MKTVAIIAEFNPFHNGHKYIVQQAKKITNADFVIVIMSGNFLQRGEAAMFNKYTRAKMAVSENVDLVIELPVAYATGSAYDFANGAINILNKLNCIDYLCFGCENIDLDLFDKIADILINEPVEYKNLLKKNLSCGQAFPVARTNALTDMLNNTGIPEFVSKPNNILGIEYICALKRANSPITPIPITRISSDYHDKTIKDTFSSATSIRCRIEEILNSSNNSICQNSLEEQLKYLSHTIPCSTTDIILNEYMKSGPILPGDILPFIQYKIITDNDFTCYCDVDEDISNKIKKMNPYTSYDCMINSLKSRNYTNTRISRSLLHCVINYTDVKRQQFVTNNYGLYANILALKKESSSLLKSATSKSFIPLITKKADFEKCFSDYPNVNLNIASQMWSLDLTSTHLYNCLLYNRYGFAAKNDLETTPIVI